LWLEFRLARLHRNQGEILERIAANKKMNCPRCSGHMRWNDEYFYFYCPTKRCGYSERVDLDRDVLPRALPPSGSEYWLVTINPPKWFWKEVM